MNSTEQTVAVQKAIGATHALVGIANGAEWRAYQQLETDTRRIVTERMAQVILDALQQPPAAPPPADSEDRQLAAIARGIAERIELHNLPISGDAHFSLIHGSTRYVGDLHEPHPAPLMESLRQLALWKAGQQVAEAGEAAPPQSLAKELAALLNKHGIDNATNTYDFVLAGYLVDCITAFKKARNTDTSLRWLEPANQPAAAAPVDALATEGAGEQKYTGDESVDNEIAGLDLIMHNETFLLKERIAELEAEVARLQRERDSAVRDADKRALLLREIEFYTDPKRRLDGQALSDKLDSIHARIVYVTASLSVPESEATDGA